MKMDNNEVAALLNNIGDTLEIIGESSFRVGAYRRAAGVISALPRDINDIRRDKGGLTSIQGVGKGIAEKLAELLDTGKMSYYEELKEKLPGSLVELIHIQGVGPKKAKLFYDELGVKSVDGLEKALQEHLVKDLPGMGVKTEDNILRGLELYKNQTGRLLLSQALPAAEKIISYLQRYSEAKEISTAGSLRRWRETIGDIDILAATDKPRKVADEFCGYTDVVSVLAKGETKCSVLLHNGLQVDLRMIKPAQFGSALQYFTGSKGHNVHLRELAKERGQKLSEYGLFTLEGNRRVAGTTEAQIYNELGLSYIEPVLREDKGELEAAAAGKLPNLIKLADIRGDLHAHTQASDGQSSLEEMAQFARKLGYQYLAISDHAQTLKVAHGLDLKRFEEQWRQIAELNSRWENFRLLRAVELNINSAGKTDFPDEVLARFDVVAASIHTGFTQDKEQITYRTVTAMANPHIDIICHPTGRILGRRLPYAIDLMEVFKAAKKTGTVLELNSFPDRLDLNDDQLREAKRHGVKFAISTDAHHFGHLANMRYGLHTAQRGWLSADDVINTLPVDSLLKSLNNSGRKVPPAGQKKRTRPRF